MKYKYLIQYLQVNNLFFFYTDFSLIVIRLYGKVFAPWQHQGKVIIQVAGLALACALKREVVLTGDHNRYRLPLATGVECTDTDRHQAVINILNINPYEKPISLSSANCQILSCAKLNPREK